ncbi:MAG: SPOR domain-containing protein [Cytophagales bacterium]|nr:SPOR domain-containing protein [Bernardetiaceae bacterium]MDW8205177.1 SPOR domain-containing protein [Cytophagales bacterium]
MRKVLLVVQLFVWSIGCVVLFSSALAQTRSEVVKAKVVANHPSERWNMAAHTQLPLGTLLQAFHASTNRKVTLKVSRRLPKNSPHAMEIFQAAADSLGISSEEATLQIEYQPAKLPRSGQIVQDAYREVTAMSPSPVKKQREYYENEDIPKEAEQQANAQTETIPPTQKQPETKPTPTPVSKKAPARSSKDRATQQAPFATAGTYNTRGIKVAVKGFGLQLHAFNEAAKALKEAIHLEKKKLGKVYIQVAKAGDRTNYRVIVGEYPTQNAAQKAAKEFKNKYQLQAIVKQHL